MSNTYTGNGESEAGRKGREGLTRRIIEQARKDGNSGMTEERARKLANDVAKRTDIDQGLR